jgi:hypothetical protein
MIVNNTEIKLAIFLPSLSGGGAERNAQSGPRFVVRLSVDLVLAQAKGLI